MTRPHRSTTRVESRAEKRLDRNRFWPITDTEGLRFASSLVFSSRSCSARQLDAIAADLTDYDRAVLLFLAEVRLATGHR